MATTTTVSSVTGWSIEPLYDAAGPAGFKWRAWHDHARVENVAWTLDEAQRDVTEMHTRLSEGRL